MGSLRAWRAASVEVPGTTTKPRRSSRNGRGSPFNKYATLASVCQATDADPGWLSAQSNVAPLSSACGERSRATSSSTSVSIRIFTISSTRAWPSSLEEARPRNSLGESSYRASALRTILPVDFAQDGPGHATILRSSPIGWFHGRALRVCRGGLLQGPM